MPVSLDDAGVCSGCEYPPTVSDALVGKKVPTVEPAKLTLSDVTALPVPVVVVSNDATVPDRLMMKRPMLFPVVSGEL